MRSSSWVLFSYLLVAVFQILCDYGYASSVISTGSPFKLYKGAYFVEVPINTNFSFECSKQNRSVWARKAEGDGEEHASACEARRGGLSLQMQMLSISDTGLYECVDVNGTALESVYVFVFDPKESSQVFLRARSTNISADGAFVVVPCRTSRIVDESEVQLFIEYRLQKKGTYDSRKGFRVERASLQNLRTTRFRCVYRSHVSQEFVLEASRPGFPVISASDWVVDYGELTVDCTIQLPDIERYSITWKTPLTNESRYKVDLHYVSQGNVLASHLSIQKADRATDSGDYECILWKKNDPSNEHRSSKVNIQVGVGMENFETIGKMRFFRPNSVAVYEGKYEITQFLETTNDYEYWRNWTKSVNGTSESALSLTELSGVKFDTENDLRKEQLLLNISNLEPLSRYRMEVHMPYIVNVVLFPVGNVLSLRVMQNGVEVSGPIGAFEEISILCSSSDVHSSPPTLYLRRGEDDDEWLPVNGAFDEFLNGIVWNTSLSSDVSVKCSNGDTQVIKDVTLSPWMQTSGTAADSKDASTVILNCTVLASQFRSVVWYNRWDASTHLRTERVPSESENLVESFLARIQNADGKDEGSYICEATTIDMTVVHQMVHIKLDDSDGGSSTASGLGCPAWNETLVYYAWRKDAKALCTAELGRRGSLRRFGDQTFECHHSIRHRGSRRNEVPETFGSLTVYQLLAIIALVVTVLVALLIATLFYARSRKTELNRLRVLHKMLVEHSSKTLDSSQPLHCQVEQLPYDVNYEIKLERLVMQKVLSNGEYGRVYAGRLKHRLGGRSMEVAVKGPKDAAKYEHMKALVDELRVMIAIGQHPNVLCLIGAVTQNMRKGEDIYVIMELCASDLKSFLVRNRGKFVNELPENDKPIEDNLYVLPRQDSVQSPAKGVAQDDSPNSGYIPLSATLLTTTDLVAIAFQVANAMEYLTTKMCVHRDLAARNILVTRRRLVRVADFGLARQCEHLYHVHSFQLPLPFKSLAPESIRELHFTQKSDVWSFGILLWEIFTLGEEPFKEIKSVEKLLSFHESGDRLPSPVYMPQQLCSLMSECWHTDASMRPNFSTCRKVIENLLRDMNPNVYNNLQNRLTEELNEMNCYKDWRDGTFAKR